MFYDYEVKSIYSLLLTNIWNELECDGGLSLSQNVEHMVRCLTLHVDSVHLDYLVHVVTIMIIMILSICFDICGHNCQDDHDEDVTS